MMHSLLKEKLLEVVGAVAPLIVVVTALQVSIVGAPAALFLQFLVDTQRCLEGDASLAHGVAAQRI